MLYCIHQIPLTSWSVEEGSGYETTSHCALHRKDGLNVFVRGFCVNRKGGREGGGWSHPQGGCQAWW